MLSDDEQIRALVRTWQSAKDDIVSQDEHHVFARHIVDVVSRAGKQDTPGADGRRPPIRMTYVWRVADE
jgi:hypothetical protein